MTPAGAIYQQGRQAAKEQKYAEAITYYTQVLAMAETQGVFRARVLEYRGECYWLLNQFEAAEQDYQESLQTAGDDVEQKGRARVRLAEVADFRGDYTLSTALYKEALAEGTAVSNLMVIGRAHRGLGILSRRVGNSETAVTHLTQALAAFRQAGEAREQARVLTSLGRTRHNRGEYHYALTCNQEALKIFESINDLWRYVQVLNDIGECHQALYDVEGALASHREALRLAEEHHINLVQPEIERNLGEDLVASGEITEGESYLQKALEGARAIGYRDLEALTLYNLARAYVQEEKLAQAHQMVADLQIVAEGLNSDRFRALAGFVRGELLFYAGNMTGALGELNAAMLAAQSSVDRGILWKLHATMGHILPDRRIAAVHLTIAAEFIRQIAEPLQDAHLKAAFLQAPPVLAVLQTVGLDPKKW